MANTMKTTNQTSAASGPRPLNDHEAARTRYNAWSQQWWNNNFREGDHDDFIVAAVLAGFRREVKLNYGPGLFNNFTLEDMATEIRTESVDHIPSFPEEIRALPVNSIGKREHEVEDNFEYKAASFCNVHVSDDDDCEFSRPAKRVRRASRDKPGNTKPKVQSETLLRRAELDSGDSDSAVPDARPEPAGAANPFRKNRNVVTGSRPKTKTYTCRKSQASYADNSDGEGENKAGEDDSAHSSDEHHASVNDFAHNSQGRRPQRTRSGSADSPISLDSNDTLEVNSSPEK